MSLLSLSISGLITFVILGIGFMIAKVSEYWFTKFSAFECGFEEVVSSRLSFSLKFFLIVLIFLVFDVEIALLLPLPMGSMISPIIWMKASWVMLLILLWGLYLEVSQGSLVWVE